MSNKRKWSRVHLPNEDFDFIEWLANFLRANERDIIMEALLEKYATEKSIYDKVNNRIGVVSEDPDNMASARAVAVGD